MYVHNHQSIRIDMLYGVPSWLQKIPGLFQEPSSIFPGPCRKPAMFKYRDKQQLLTIYIQNDSSIHTGVYVHHCHMLWRNSKGTVRTQNRGARTRIFWRLHPHHCPANSRTFPDQTHFPELARCWKFHKENSRQRGNLGNILVCQVYCISIISLAV